MNYTIITIDDESGLLDREDFDPDSIPSAFPLFSPVESDLIFIRPDWPPIGSPDFADRLRAWHASNNPGCHSERSEESQS